MPSTATIGLVFSFLPFPRNGQAFFPSGIAAAHSNQFSQTKADIKETSFEFDFS